MERKGVVKMSDFIFAIVITLCLVGIIFCGFMQYRINVVFKVGDRLIDELKDERLYIAFNRKTYTKMLFQLTKFHWTLDEVLAIHNREKERND